MIQQNNAALLPISSWTTQSLRFTAFPKAPINTSEIDWWKKTVGFPAENVTLNSRIDLRQEEGDTKLGHLVLAVIPVRIDWLLPEELDKPGNPAFEDSVNQFQAYIERWLEIAPVVQRIAFGAAIEAPTESRASGYRQLSPYLPFVEIDAEGSSDFQYQINRPRNSTLGIQGLRINRLSKWGVSVRVLGAVPAAAGNQEAQVAPTMEKHACRLEMDVNTAPRADLEFSRDATVKIAHELIALAFEIASKGDVK